MKSSQNPEVPIAGFDWGTRRIGVAISPDGHLVFPREHIQITNQNDAFVHVLAFIKEERIRTIVLGFPVSLCGQENTMTRLIKEVGNTLKRRADIPVLYVDERFSTREAKGKISEKHQKNVDSLSAQVVLQSFLDTL